jgi:hypothetical protein
MQHLFQNIGKSIPKTFLFWKQTKATYRFISNPRVRKEDLSTYEHQVTNRNIELSDDSVILYAQDTTDISFLGRNNIPDMGYLKIERLSGIKVHSVLACSEEGVPFGISYRKSWVRDIKEYGKKSQRKHKPLEQKESHRWLESIKAVEASAPSGKTAVVIGDRESDIFEVFSSERKDSVKLLIRCSHNRLLKEAGVKLFEYIRSQPVQTTHIVNKNGKMFTASVRYCPVTITKKGGIEYVALNCVQIEAQNTEWILLTDLPVVESKDAIRIAHYYTVRWKIEMYHFTLKSGCNIEKIQFESKDRIEKVLCMYSIVAVYVMELTYSVRTNPTQQLTNFFTDQDMKAIATRYHSLYGRDPPEHIDLSEVVLFIGRLGGHMGRRSDGWPGVRAVWDGLKDLAVGVNYMGVRCG